MQNKNFNRSKIKEAILATCFRCGHKYNIAMMGHVGNDTYECAKCLLSSTK